MKAGHQNSLAEVRSLIQSGLDQALRSELLDGEEVLNALEKRIGPPTPSPGSNSADTAPAGSRMTQKRP